MPRRRRPPRPGALAELSPLRIVTQIAALQALHYVCGAALILFAALVAGRPFSADLVLHWSSLRGDTTVGWMLSLCWMADSLVGVVALLLLVARSKLVPDFVITLHVIHLVVVSLYAHAVPPNVLWWALQVCSAASMISLGVWGCRWRELQPISFGGSAPTSSDDAAAAAAAQGPAKLAGDEEQGFVRGGRRGRGRDGAGEYEMVGLSEVG